MDLSLAKERLFFLVLKEIWRNKLKLPSLEVTLLSIQPIIMVKCLWLKQLSEWLKISLAPIILTCLCLMGSLVLAMKVAKIMPQPDTYLLALTKWRDLFTRNPMTMCSLTLKMMVNLFNHSTMCQYCRWVLWMDVKVSELAGALMFPTLIHDKLSV